MPCGEMGVCTTDISTVHTSIWVSSQELEEVPSDKSLWSVSASFTSPDRQGLWGPSSGQWASLVAWNLLCPEPAGSWAGGEKNQNSHVSWEKGQSWHRQDPYSPHTSQPHLVFNAFSNLQMYLQQNYHYCSWKTAASWDLIALSPWINWLVNSGFHMAW